MDEMLKKLNAYRDTLAQLPEDLQALFPGNRHWRCSAQNFMDDEYIPVTLTREHWERLLKLLVESQEQTRRPNERLFNAALGFINTPGEITKLEEQPYGELVEALIKHPLFAVVKK